MNENYYETADFSPIFKINPNFFRFRQIRLLKDGRMFKINYNIRNADQLKKVLMKYNPDKAYYMVSQFSNSTRVGAKQIVKQGYPIADNLFLQQKRIVFDIDTNPVENTQKLLEWLKKEGYEIEYIIKSGQKGFHVSIIRPLKISSPDPTEREALTLEENKKLVSRIIEAGIEIDPIVSNTRQIIKCPLSLSSDVVCEFVREGSLAIAYSKMTSVKTTLKGEKETKHNFSPNTDLSELLKVSNSVIGTKGNNILFLKYKLHELKDIETLTEHLKQLVAKYKLPDLYLFTSFSEEENHLVAICPKLFQKARLYKILKNEDKLSLTKYKHNIINIANLKHFSTIEGHNENQPISKGHLNFLNESLNLNITPHPTQTLAGNPQINYMVRTKQGEIYAK